MNAGEWCELSALHDRECASYIPPTCVCTPLSPEFNHHRNSIGCAELHFLDSVPLVGVACHHNSSSAHLIPSRPFGSATGRLKAAQGFRVFSMYYQGLHSPRHTNSGFAELRLWEARHVATMHPSHSDVAPEYPSSARLKHCGGFVGNGGQITRTSSAVPGMVGIPHRATSLSSLLGYHLC